ncbi:hypothetical protein EMIT0P100_10705 [Pseudomonas sp. IT-P100]
MLGNTGWSCEDGRYRGAPSKGYWWVPGCFHSGYGWWDAFRIVTVNVATKGFGPPSTKSPPSVGFLSSGYPFKPWQFPS